ncbi:hypothetical protein [Methylobacterium durans]|uniref:hypothetical protein n=1 Tax=Methylobacterium durans TaxID=2202825 RepID=UPI0013A5A101|nr:hypothetical protein [Methylobacterium durans]
MMVNPKGMSHEELMRIRIEVGRTYGIKLYQQYPEREAARLLLPSDERPEGSADTSTLKRKRRTNKIPYVACGDGSVAYLGLMLCDFIIFGENSMLLWGDNAPPPSPQAPPDDAAPSP